MLQDSKAFSGFSVNDLAEAEKFYGDTLGLKVDSNDMGLTVSIAGSSPIFVYPKEDHVPATYTILNFPVVDIDEAVANLAAQGVKFEHYEGMTDGNGVARGIAAGRGPDIAWFKDPAGNILSILNNG